MPKYTLKPFGKCFFCPKPNEPYYIQFDVFACDKCFDENLKKELPPRPAKNYHRKSKWPRFYKE